MNKNFLAIGKTGLTLLGIIGLLSIIYSCKSKQEKDLSIDQKAGAKQKNAIHLTKSNKPHYFVRKKEYV